MTKNQNNPKRKTRNLFLVITSAVLAAAVIWFLILPLIFNSASSLIKNIFSTEEEIKFEAFSPEAFAYDIGDSWEVNTTVNVRGFEKLETNDETSVSLSYSIDLINPDGEVIKDIFSDSKEVKDKEVNDVQLEAQFELDYNSARGKYKIIFNIEDNNSGKSIPAQAEFELED